MTDDTNDTKMIHNLTRSYVPVTSASDALHPPFSETKEATNEENDLLFKLTDGSYQAWPQEVRKDALDDLRAHVKKEVEKVIMERAERDIATCELYLKEHEQQAIEKAMSELRKRIVVGQENFRTHNMKKDANTLDVVITEIDMRWPKAKEVK